MLIKVPTLKFNLIGQIHDSSYNHYIKGSINNAFFILQLEKAREATDAANLRAAYAEVVTASLTGDTKNQTKTVTITQGTKGWGDSSITKIGDITIAGSEIENVVSPNVVTLTYTSNGVTLAVAEN